MVHALITVIYKNKKNIVGGKEIVSTIWPWKENALERVAPGLAAVT